MAYTGKTYFGGLNGSLLSHGMIETDNSTDIKAEVLFDDPMVITGISTAWTLEQVFIYPLGAESLSWKDGIKNVKSDFYPLQNASETGVRFLETQEPFIARKVSFRIRGTGSRQPGVLELRGCHATKGGIVRIRKKMSRFSNNFKRFNF